MAMPIKFTPELERAVLDKKKTETRRLMDPQPVHEDGGYYWPSRKDWKLAWAAEDSTLSGIKKQDDWRPHVIFEQGHDPSLCPYGAIGRWFPVGSEIRQITGIRIERIQGITEESMLAEGLTNNSGYDWGYECLVEDFQDLWESIYPGSWERNEWVWVIQFGEVVL